MPCIKKSRRLKSVLTNFVHLFNFFAAHLSKSWKSQNFLCTESGNPVLCKCVGGRQNFLTACCIHLYVIFGILRGNYYINGCNGSDVKTEFVTIELGTKYRELN